MLFDPIRIAQEVPTVRQFEELVLLELEAAVGFDAAFMTLRGASPTTMGLDPIRLGEALRPGSAYEDELEPVKKAALAARGVAVDTDVLGVARVHAAAYFRDLARPLGWSRASVGPRQFVVAYPGIRLDVVDSDPVVVDLARTFYRVDEIPNLALHVADGASFVARARPASWDVAVVDAYDGDALGDGIAAPGFFDALRAALRPGGAIAFNLVGSLDGAELRTVVRAAGRSFDDLRVVPVMTAAESYHPGATRNIVLVGLRRP